MPTVRHAMGVLRSRALIETRHGVGTFVRNTRHDFVFGATDDIELDYSPMAPGNVVEQPAHWYVHDAFNGTAFVTTRAAKAGDEGKSRLSYLHLGDGRRSDASGKRTAYFLARRATASEARQFAVPEGSPALVNLLVIGVTGQTARIVEEVFVGFAMVEVPN